MKKFNEELYRKAWKENFVNNPYDGILYLPPSLMTIFEYIGTPIQPHDIPFDDISIQHLFPIVEGTKHARMICEFPKEWVPEIANIIQKDDWYEKRLEKLEQLIEKYQPSELFKEHSLSLLIEHLKTFSPYSKNARKLLRKLTKLK